MKKYYTRVCNFYYGNISKKLVKQKKTLPLNGNAEISFDHIEILSKNFKKKIHIKEIRKLSKFLKNKVNRDIKIIIKKNKNFSNFNFKNIPNIMGILNLTPDSFSDGGKFNKKNLGYKRAILLFKQGANIVDVGGESTRPGSKAVKTKVEWNRISSTIKKFNKKIVPSLDTRKSEIMEKGIKIGVKLINDVSGLKYDKKSINVLKEPAFKAYIQESHLPNPNETIKNGYWVEEETWPSENISLQQFDLLFDLDNNTDNNYAVINSPLSLGLNSGEYMPISGFAEYPQNQKEDDAKSVCFESKVLENDIEILWN